MRRGTAVLLAVIAGCTFGSDGGGLDGPGPADPEGSSSSGGTTTSAGPPATGEGDGDGTSADGTTGSTTSDSASTGEPTPAGEATLEISGGPTVDLGELPVGALHAFDVTLDNIGDGPATVIVAPALADPFVYDGGAYPGNGGTCTDTLAAGQGCTLALEVTPVRPGLDNVPVEVSYVGAQMPKVLTGQIRVVGNGTSDNLLLNPGAEAGAAGQLPPDWSVASGDGWEATTAEVDSGNQSFWAGDSNNSGDAVLLQDVDVDVYGPTIDLLGMSASFSGRARTMAWLDDPHNLRVVYLDVAGSGLGAWDAGFHDETGWHTHAMTRAIPSGTRAIRVELLCDKDLGSNCSAWFDTLDLRVSYPAQ